MKHAALIVAFMFPCTFALRLRIFKDGRISQGDDINQQAHDLFYATHPGIAKKHQYSVEEALEAQSTEWATTKLRQVTSDAFEGAKGDWMQFNWRDCSTDLDAHVDVLLEDKTGWKPLVEWFKKNPTGIPIVKFGFCPVDQKDNGWHDWTPARFAEWKQARAEIGDDTRQFSAIFAGNENWGLLSLWHPNRTATWRKFFEDGEVQNVLEFLDDPMVKVWAHLQHLDIKHPKLIMMPLTQFYDDVTKDDLAGEKADLAGFYGSTDMARAMILQKVKENLGNEVNTGAGKNDEGVNVKVPGGREGYKAALARSKFVVKPSGMGMDNYGIWEALQMASIPVVERGFGNEPLMGQLPILLVDDYEKISPELLRAVEPYFELHAEDFNWNLIRKSYWLEGMHGKDGFLESFVDVDTLPPAPHANKNNEVFPEHCMAQLPMTCPGHENEPQAADDDHLQICCANPKGTPKGFAFHQLKMKNQEKPWAFGFVPHKIVVSL